MDFALSREESARAAAFGRPVTLGSVEVVAQLQAQQPQPGVINCPNPLPQAPAREQSLLEDILQYAPAAIAVTVGINHVFRMVNPRYQKIKPDEEMIGRSVAEVFPELKQQGLIEILDHVFRTGEPYQATDTRVFLRGDNGDLRETYWSFSYIPNRNDRGEVEEILQIAVETTEAVKARATAAGELAAATQAAAVDQVERRNLQSIIDAMPVGVVVVDAPSGRVSLINRAAAALLGPPLKVDMTMDDYLNRFRLYLPPNHPVLPE
jgi:PAS domain S-box-containing protein